MLRLGHVLAGLLLMSCISSAKASVLEGWLELQWGDPVKGSAAAPQFRATLVLDDGRRFPLDADQALRAAEDLHALANRRIAVEFSSQGAGVSQYRVEAIVPADNLRLPTAKAYDKAVLGNTVWVTLMCKFSDIATEQKSLSFFQSQYGNSQGQLDHFWREVSYGKINLTGSSAYGWFTLPQPRSYYIGSSANLNQLFDDCVAAANPSVNFAANGGVQGINMMFNGDLDGYAWGGGRSATLDGINKRWSVTWNPPWSFNNLAPLAHEMGHGYGLPHANNSDGDSDPYDNPWDVMSSAWRNANSNPTYGTVAKHLNTYSRERLGWIAPARMLTVSTVVPSSAIQLDRASMTGSTNPQMLVLRVPGEPATRYYTVEARKRVGYYDANLAGNAVIIHAVNTGRKEPSWSVDTAVPPADVANNEGSMFKPGESWRSPGGHFQVSVLSENANGFVVSLCGALFSGPPSRKSMPCISTIGLPPHREK